MTAGGTTRTHVGGNYTINATGISGEANAANTAGSDAVPISINLVEVGEVTAEVRTTHETEAFVSRDADFTLNGGGIELDAISRNDATLDRVDLGVSLVGIGTLKPVVQTAGATRAFVEEGGNLSAGSLSLEAAAANDATLDSVIVAVSLVDISVIRPTVQTTHVIDAYVGPRAGVARNGTAGSIDLAGGLRSLLSAVETEVREVSALSERIDKLVAELNARRDDQTKRLLALDALRASVDDASLGAFLDKAIRPRKPRVAEVIPQRLTQFR
jgi:hypothetical protein